MASRILQKLREYGFESLVLLVVFVGTWIGYGQYMWGPLFLGFFGALFFKRKRALLFHDKILLFLVIALTINNIISSLFAIDNPKTPLISASWFFALFVPLSYTRFSLNSQNDFFIKWILPVSIICCSVILVYLFGAFIHHSATAGLEFKRYTFLTFGRL